MPVFNAQVTGCYIAANGCADNLMDYGMCREGQYHLKDSTPWGIVREITDTYIAEKFSIGHTSMGLRRTIYTYKKNNCNMSILDRNGKKLEALDPSAKKNGRLNNAPRVIKSKFCNLPMIDPTRAGSVAQKKF